MHKLDEVIELPPHAARAFMKDAQYKTVKKGSKREFRYVSLLVKYRRRWYTVCRTDELDEVTSELNDLDASKNTLEGLVTAYRAAILFGVRIDMAKKTFAIVDSATDG